MKNVFKTIALLFSLFLQLELLLLQGSDTYFFNHQQIIFGFLSFVFLFADIDFIRNINKPFNKLKWLDTISSVLIYFTFLVTALCFSYFIIIYAVQFLKFEQ
jgi:hypothetical protein